MDSDSFRIEVVDEADGSLSIGLNLLVHQINLS